MLFRSIFANMGKMIEAYERTIPLSVTRFDDYAAALAAQDFTAADNIFTESERNGLKLFLFKGDCMRCHGGPLFTDMHFHNIALPNTTADLDNGRDNATKLLKSDPFNCLGEFSDAVPPKGCEAIKLMKYDREEKVGAFKATSLRGVGQRGPYMHNGQFTTLHDVLLHYNRPPKALYGSSDLLKLDLSEKQLSELEAFLLTLNFKSEAVK